MNKNTMSWGEFKNRIRPFTGNPQIWKEYFNSRGEMFRFFKSIWQKLFPPKSKKGQTAAPKQKSSLAEVCAPQTPKESFNGEQQNCIETEKQNNEKIRKLEQEVVELQSALFRLREQIQHLQTTVDQKNQTIDRKDIEIDNLRHEKENMGLQIKSMKLIKSAREQKLANMSNGHVDDPDVLRKKWNSFWDHELMPFVEDLADLDLQLPSTWRAEIQDIAIKEAYVLAQIVKLYQIATQAGNLTTEFQSSTLQELCAELGIRSEAITKAFKDKLADGLGLIQQMTQTDEIESTLLFPQPGEPFSEVKHFANNACRTTTEANVLATVRPGYQVGGTVKCKPHVVTLSNKEMAPIDGQS